MNKTTVILVVLLATALATRAQGPLTPPGAPAPTMKTLDQIEPRIPITNLPFSVFSPGSYYLTGNLAYSFTNQPAIQVFVGGVTIDLNGYTIINFGGTDTIYCQALGLSSLTIKNGLILLGKHAVYAPLMEGVRLEQIEISNASRTGVVAGANAQILNSKFYQSLSGDGVVVGAGSRVIDSVFQGNQKHGLVVGSGSVIEACHSSGNAGAGFVLEQGSVLRNSSAESNQIYGVFSYQGGLLENLTLLYNRAGAVVGNGTRISGCSIRHSVQEGIYGDNEVSVERTTVAASGQRGIFLFNGGLVRDCIVRANQQAGILVHSGCAVLDNVVDLNGAGNNEGGIAVYGSSNRIEGNHITSNADKGLWLLSGGNTVFKNSLRGNGTAISDGGGNDVGPQDPAGIATSPWANITY